jgi:hypothetical protein
MSIGTDDYTEDCMALEVIAKAVLAEMMGSDPLPTRPQ